MNLISRGLDLRKFDANTFASAALRAPSAGAGSDARFLEGKLAEIAEHRFTRAEQAKLTVGGDASLKVRLFDTLAALKVHTSSVAMHLRDDWRLRLFRQLDNLLSSGDWLDEDVPPHIGSFATFIRIILSLRPEQQPGLAATSGSNLIASWTTAEGDSSRSNVSLSIACVGSFLGTYPTVLRLQPAAPISGASPMSWPLRSPPLAGFIAVDFENSAGRQSLPALRPLGRLRQRMLTTCHRDPEAHAFRLRPDELFYRAAWIFFSRCNAQSAVDRSIACCARVGFHAAARWVRDRQRDENSCSLCGALKTGSNRSRA